MPPSTKQSAFCHASSVEGTLVPRPHADAAAGDAVHLLPRKTAQRRRASEHRIEVSDREIQCLRCRMWLFHGRDIYYLQRHRTTSESNSASPPACPRRARITFRRRNRLGTSEVARFFAITFFVAFVFISTSAFGRGLERGPTVNAVLVPLPLPLLPAGEGKRPIRFRAPGALLAIPRMIPMQNCIGKEWILEDNCCISERQIVRN